MCRMMASGAHVYGLWAFVLFGVWGGLGFRLPTLEVHVGNEISSMYKDFDPQLLCLQSGGPQT